MITNFGYQVGIAADNARLFEAQQEALRVKDQFLSIVSHELRTPLTTIKGYSQMLTRKITDDPTSQRFATNIDIQVSRLSRLVDDLLDITRFSRGQFELKRQHVDLRPVLEDIISRFRVVAPSYEFELELDEGSFLGFWDRDRLEQVMNNLIGNAIKYSHSGTTVTVTTRHEDDELIVSVRDQGTGIPQEEQERLFERFYRGSAGEAASAGWASDCMSRSALWMRTAGRSGSAAPRGKVRSSTFRCPSCRRRWRSRRHDKTPTEIDRGPGEVLVVGETGFEPATPCTPCKCATRLRHSPRSLEVSLAPA